MRKLTRQQIGASLTLTGMLVLLGGWAAFNAYERATNPNVIIWMSNSR